VDVSSGDTCALTGSAIDDGNIVIYGTVGPYSVDGEYICGVLFWFDPDLNAYDDVLMPTLNPGSITLMISIAPQPVSNEYLILALPKDFVNGDAITVAFQVNLEMQEGVTELGEASSFDTSEASTFYSHTFNV